MNTLIISIDFTKSILSEFLLKHFLIMLDYTTRKLNYKKF